MSLRMEFSATPNDDDSWTYLPGGGQMTLTSDGQTWDLNTTNLPIGNNISFRVIASAPDYVDLDSALLGPFQIGTPLSVTSTSVSTGGVRHLDDFLGIGAAVMNFIHVVGVDVHLIPANNATTTQGGITLTADQGGTVDLTVSQGQTLTAPGGLNLGNNTTLIAAGTVNADVNNGIVASGAGNVLSANGSAIVASGAGNAVSYNAASATAVAEASLAQNTASPVLSANGSAIVSDGAGNVIGVNGSAAAGGNTKGYSPAGGPLQPKPNDQPPTQPSFTGIMTVNGNYNQFSGALIIAIAGTNILSNGAQQYDQLLVNGQANFFGGQIAFGLFNPDDQTNQSGIFQPPDGATFDVVVASNIVTQAIALRGPIWGDGQFFNWGVVTRPDGLQALRLVVTNIPPPLFLQSAGPALQLIYPTNYTGYTVESSPDLVNWSTFSTGTNVVPLCPDDAGQFFRLSNP